MCVRLTTLFFVPPCVFISKKGKVIVEIFCLILKKTIFIFNNFYFYFIYSFVISFRKSSAFSFFITFKHIIKSSKQSFLLPSESGCCKPNKEIGSWKKNKGERK